MKSSLKTDVEWAWAEFWQEPNDPERRNRLIVNYLPMVKQIAQKMKDKLPNDVEYDDLVHVGVFGLIDAIEKYDPARGVEFGTFAYLRIRGAIIDGLRANDILSRTQRGKAKRFKAALNDLAFRLGRTPTEAETAAELGIDVESLGDYARVAVEAETIYLDAPHPLNRRDGGRTFVYRDTVKAAGDDMRVAKLREFMELADGYMDRRERTMMRLRYFQEWPMLRIGNYLGMSESRISQLHETTLIRLRSRLALLEEDFFQ